MSGRGIVASSTTAERSTSTRLAGTPPTSGGDAPDGPPRSGWRARLVGIAALAASIAVVALLAIVGQGTSDTAYDFESPGVWLATTARGQKITHIALATDAPDARIDLTATFPGGFATAADAHLTVLRSAGGTCHLDRLDEAKLNLAKRDPRLELGPGPCDRYRVAVGGDRVYVVDAQEGSVRQLDPRHLAAGAEEVTVPTPVADVEVDDGGLLVVVAGEDARALRAVRDGAVVRTSSLERPTQAVLVGDHVALVDDRTVTGLDEHGAPGRRTSVPGGIALDDTVPDQPGGALAVPTADGTLAIVDGTGDLTTVDPLVQGPAVVLGEVVYVLGRDGATPIGLDGQARPPLSATDDAASSELVEPDVGATEAEGTYEAVVSHGRLWIHHPARSRGWACDAEGRCRAFEKNSRTTPEVAATQPDEPDPPRTIDPDTATTSTTVAPRTSVPAGPLESSTTTTSTPRPPAVVDSPPTPPVVVAPPGPVTELVASSLDGGAELRWRPPGTGARPDRYHVDVLGSGERPGVPDRPGPDGTLSFTVDGLTNGRPVEIEVWASAGGVAGPRTRAAVTPSARTPTDVRASIRQDEICAALGEPESCGAGADPSAVLVTWTDAPGVTSYQVGCNVGGAPTGSQVTTPAGEGRAVISVPTGAAAACWVAADGGGWAQAGASITVVGLPEVAIVTGNATTGAAWVQATITRHGGSVIEGRVDDVPVGVAGGGRIDLADRPSGSYRITATAINERGAGRAPAVDVVLSPGSVTGLAEQTPRAGCCVLRLRWQRVAEDDGGYVVTVRGIPAVGCDPGCLASTSDSSGFDIDLGGHAGAWASIVDAQGISPSTPYNDYVFDVVTTVTIGVTAEGSTAAAATLDATVAPSTPVTLGPGALLHTDETLDPSGTVDVAGAAASALCALRQGPTTQAIAVRTDDGRTGWVAPTDAPVPDEDALPDC